MGEATNALSLLPSDCWWDILDLISIKDLISTSCTYAELHFLAKPVLYRNISWIWDEISIRQILQLLWNIWQDPERAVYIRHVSWAFSTQMGDWVLPKLNAN